MARPKRLIGVKWNVPCSSVGAPFSEDIFVGSDIVMQVYCVVVSMH